MKKITLSIALSISLLSFSQTKNNKFNDWLISVGMNAINNLGTQNPIHNPDDWYIENPLAIAAETTWSKNFSIEIGASMNKVKEGERSDPANVSEDFNYFSLDVHVKWYFGKYIFPETEWLDFYTNAGLGIWKFNEINSSPNFGGGMMVWLNDKHTFALRGQVIGKIGLNSSKRGSNNNHYQYSVQAVFKL